jgi:hypothetical protein
MNFEETDSYIENIGQNGYKMIFDDIEQKYIYFVLKAGESKEIPRDELLEIIKSGKPMPVIEIREKFYAASNTAKS